MLRAPGIALGAGAMFAVHSFGSTFVAQGVV